MLSLVLNDLVFSCSYSDPPYRLLMVTNAMKYNTNKRPVVWRMIKRKILHSFSTGECFACICDSSGYDEPSGCGQIIISMLILNIHV